MDKQKQIEEIAKDIAKRDCYLWEHCPKEPKHNCISQEPKIMLESSKNYITIAMWLVEAGYRKIPKNAVVLTETERITMSVEQWDKGYNQGRKVTAEKFAERLKEIEIKLELMGNKYSQVDIKATAEGLYKAFMQKVDEIAKEITEGV